MENTKEMALFIGITVLSILFLATLIGFVLLWSKRKLLEKEKILQEAENRKKLELIKASVEKEKILQELENRKQLELIKAIVETEEIQKTKIARDLHDQLIPLLTLKALNLNKILTELENGGKDYKGAKKALQEIADLSDQVREIAHGIVPKMSGPFRLVTSIKSAVRNINGINNVKAIFEDNTSFSGELPFSENRQLTIYRICLELINNLLKHAKFSYLTVTAENTQSQLSVLFAHNGIGITNDKINELTLTSKGIGLKSLQSRALSLDAEIEYALDKEVSFVNLKIPLKF